MIFPNRYRSNNHIQGNIRYSIPSKLNHFDFTVVPPCGVEILKVYASTHPLPNLEGDLISGGVKRLKLSVEGITGKMRGVAVIGKSGTEKSNVDHLLTSGLIERAEASCVVTTVCK